MLEKLKKYNIVARSSEEEHYRVIAFTTCELVCLQQLLQELKFYKTGSMKLICDN